MIDTPKVGATGEFPDGKINKEDEGELQISVGFDPDTKLVRLEFGKPVAWLAMKPEDAVNLGQTLVRHGQRGARKNRIIIS